MRFASDNGMLLELSPHENYQCIYFNCGPISAYSESEYLFFGADSILQIVTIRSLFNEEWINYGEYLKPIHFLLQIISGTGCNDLSDSAQKKLIHMIEKKKIIKKIIY
eukprot:424484_1